MRRWVGKPKAGAVDEDVQAADLIRKHEAEIAALDRMVGRQAFEIEPLKRGFEAFSRPRSATTSVPTGPAAFLPPEGTS